MARGAMKTAKTKASSSSVTGKSKVISSSTPKWLTTGGASGKGGNTKVMSAKAR